MGEFQFQTAPVILPLVEDASVSRVHAVMMDEIAEGAYTAEEFNEIRDYLFGLAAQGHAEWECLRDEPKAQTYYIGKGTSDFVQLMIAFCKGEGIKYMDIMGWR